ncbi:MAG: hypothetical protein GWO24_36155, partial [Akkermansiaceae bacterium]|nr:hypothetical protein [Akkermansiaceae bacterium]
DTKLTEFISKQQDLDLFRGYSVLTALGNAPELKALDKAIEAQELVLAQRKRTYFMPRLFAQFDYRHYLDREFAGAGTLPGGGSAGDPEDEVWTFAVAANLPVFEG